MLALSGSVLMMMLVSILFFVPAPSSLRADITADLTPHGVTIQIPENKYYSGREPDEILKTIQEYVQGNDPDTAKKLYDELYSAQRYAGIPMGGEVEMAVR